MITKIRGIIKNVTTDFIKKTKTDDVRCNDCDKNLVKGEYFVMWRYGNIVNNIRCLNCSLKRYKNNLEQVNKNDFNKFKKDYEKELVIEAI